VRSRAGDLARAGVAPRTPWAPGAPALAAAARAVYGVIGGQSADAALADSLAAVSPSQGAAVRAIALGTLRWYLRLVPAIDALLARRVAAPVHALLATGAHQIEYSRHAPQATVHASVDAARLLAVPRATGLVNAVLRRFVTERGALLQRVDAELAGRTAHPGWLVERIGAAWPARAANILAANNEQPPMTLRVDITRTTAADYVRRLAAASIDAREIQWLQSAVTLTHPVSTDRLPGFAEGVASVQDSGAQIAAPLLDARPGMRVLDACAAPGGKTGHLLELLEAAAGAELTAVELEADRLTLIAQNLARLKRSARLCVGDAREPATFWDGRPFERILVDAPCSATGVIRRHPDIKLLRRPADIPAFAATQLEILRAAAQLLAPGGRLVYSTCSILPEENEQVVAALLSAEPRLGAAPTGGVDRAPGALPREIGVQLLPGAEAGTDGFYYACLEKTTAEA
jgi:16S rRNA (cytosine967-C5)-methyltransferase